MSRGEGKIYVNTCQYEDLRALPGVGKAIADHIWRYRHEVGPFTEEVFYKIPRLRVTSGLMNLVDFSITPPRSRYNDDIFDDEGENYPYPEQDRVPYPDHDYGQSRKSNDIEVQDYYDYGDIETEPRETRSYKRETTTPRRMSSSTPRRNDYEPLRRVTSDDDINQNNARLRNRDIFAKQPQPCVDTCGERRKTVNFASSSQNAVPRQVNKQQNEMPDVLKDWVMNLIQQHMTPQPSQPVQQQPGTPFPGNPPQQQPVMQPQVTPTMYGQHPTQYATPMPLTPYNLQPQRLQYTPYGQQMQQQTQPLPKLPSALPKSLIYDGTGNWQAFFTKFNRYSEAAGWGPRACKDQLCFCLTGKASEHYAMLLERDPDLSYYATVQKFEKRFGAHELQETVELQFSNAKQRYGEDLEDWTDRVLQLANKAFRDLPDEYVNRQMILRLCQGCLDKDAGQHAINARPRTIDDAIDKIRWYQHTSKAIFGSKVNTRENLAQEPTYNEPVENATAAAMSRNDEKPKPQTNKPIPSKIESLVEKMSDLIVEQKDEIQVLQEEISKMRKQHGKNQYQDREQNQDRQQKYSGERNYDRNRDNWNRSGRPQDRGVGRGYRSQSAPRYQPRECYQCGSTDHLKRNCPELNNEETIISQPESSLPNKSEKRPEKTGEKQGKIVTLQQADDDDAKYHMGKTVTVRQLYSASLLRLDMHLQDVQVTAVVDTAAEVTIVSDELFQRMENKPPVKQRITMHAAGKGMKMDAFLCGPVVLKIGTKEYKMDIYVAQIDDTMLLGIDFLVRFNVILDCRKKQFIANGDVLQMSYGNSEVTPCVQSVVKVSKVMIPRKTVIPANSMVQLPCNLSEKLNGYMVEPTFDENFEVLVPRGYYKEQEYPCISLLNLTDTPITLKKGHEIGEAMEAEMVDDVPLVGVSRVTTHQEDTLIDLPPFLQCLYEKSCKNLNKDQTIKLKKLLYDYSDIFAKNEFDLGTFDAIEHEIDTGSARPIKQRMRRTPMCFANEEEQHLKKLLDAGIVEPSNSEWASPPVLVRKRDGNVRWCIDYRRLNSVCRKDVFPLPLIEECIDTLSGNLWFSKLDANSAYYQVKIKESDREKSAFITKYGLFHFVRMSFGLTNAPGTYSRVMNLVLRGLTWNIVLAFLDDILVMGKSFEDHLTNLELVFERFREHGLKLKPKKCDLFGIQTEFLGRTITRDGMSMGSGYADTVETWPEPTCTREVERFLGFANYHRTFIDKFADIAYPLSRLTGKQPFQWGETEQDAFDQLKYCLTHTPVLALPNASDQFILDCDASDYAIGGELLQVQNGQERTIAYASFTLHSEQRRYCTTRKELLAVVMLTRHFRHYLLGREFVCRTDHSSLTWLLNFREPQGQLARWLEELSQYHMTVKHRPGKYHVDADALSRLKHPTCLSERAEVGQLLHEHLPCNACAYCTRHHEHWLGFREHVDNVVPLANLISPRIPVTDEPEVTTVSAIGVTPRGDQVDNAAVCKLKQVDEVQVRLGGFPRVNGELASSDKSVNNVLLKPREKSRGNRKKRRRRKMKLDSRIREMHKSEQPVNVHVRMMYTAKENVAVYRLGFDDVEPYHSSIDISSTPIGVSVYAMKGLEAATYSGEQLRESQARDPDLELVLRWLVTKTDLPQADVFKSSARQKQYYVNRDNFFFDEEGVLYGHVQNKDQEVTALVVPKDMREEVIALSHDIPASGHPGISRTKERIKAKYFWYGLGTDVKHYVSTCEVCNVHKKPNRNARCPLTEYFAGECMERVHLDFLGPLPETPRGNAHILVMVDQFSKWVECIPLPTQTAEDTARAAVDQFFSRFGYPFQVYSDQGRNFESRLFKAVCDLLHIHKARTTPYRPSSNGQVERFNRTLMDAVRCFVSEQQDDWDLYIAQLAGAIRSSVNRSTGFTPNMLMLGREVNTPVDLLYKTPNSQENLSQDEYVTKLQKAIWRAHELAREMLNTTHKNMKRDYDVRVLEKQYNVGDYVYVLDTAKIKGRAKKLDPPWKGPGIICKQLSPYVYKVRFYRGVVNMNHDRIKLCTSRTIPEWLQGLRTRVLNGEDISPSSERDLYCFCRKPDDGRLMIQCEKCFEWFHAACLQMTKRQADRLVTFFCPQCH